MAVKTYKMKKKRFHGRIVQNGHVFKFGIWSDVGASALPV